MEGRGMLLMESKERVGCDAKLVILLCTIIFLNFANFGGGGYAA